MLCLLDGDLSTTMLVNGLAYGTILTAVSLVCYLFLPLIERRKWLLVVFVALCHVPFVCMAVFLWPAMTDSSIWNGLLTLVLLYMMYATYFLPMLLSGYLRYVYRLRDRR